MGTITRDYTHSGYCPIDKDRVSIMIRYSSLQLPREDKRNKQFTKAQNLCEYLADGRCALGNSCPIFEDAPKFQFENYTGIAYQETENDTAIANAHYILRDHQIEFLYKRVTHHEGNKKKL